MVQAFFVVLCAVLVYVTAVFFIAWQQKRLDIVDIAWGGGFIVAALVSLLLGVAGPLQLLATGLVLVWGLRLSFYILKRVRSTSEDPRYQEMRRSWRGNPALNAYGRIFVTQGLLAFVICSSVVLINLSFTTTAITSLALLGSMVWLIGFVFESVGDAQLRRYLAQPKNKGKIMTTGLWRYTRHPNYFGEAVQWWGIWIIALSVPFGWLAIVSPLLITYLLLFVSGVPLTEKRFEGRPGWNAYKKQTSVFLPMTPKK